MDFAELEGRSVLADRVRQEQLNEDHAEALREDVERTFDVPKQVWTDAKEAPVFHVDYAELERRALGAIVQPYLDELERVKALLDRARDLLADKYVRDACLRAEGRAEMLAKIAAEDLKEPGLAIWQVRERLAERLAEREGNVRRVVELLERAADKLNLRVFFAGSPDIPGLHELRTALALLKTGTEEGR